MHKEAAAVKGMLVVIVTEGYVTNLFSVTNCPASCALSRNHRDAQDLFDTLKIKETEAQQEGRAFRRRGGKTAKTKGTARLLCVF